MIIDIDQQRIDLGIERARLILDEARSAIRRNRDKDQDVLLATLVLLKGVSTPV